MNIRNKNNRSSVLGVLVSIILIMVGLSYSSVPLYRAFCQMTGYGGTIQVSDLNNGIGLNAGVSTSSLNNDEDCLISVKFNSDVHGDVPWEFKPSQGEVIVGLGESTLAFYKVKNLSDQTITGVSTYNVSPHTAGLYFNKVQCFCFDEQRLRPHESLDLPVLFFVDPSIKDDPSLTNTKSVTLSYTFFKVDTDE